MNRHGLWMGPFPEKGEVIPGYRVISGKIASCMQSWLLLGHIKMSLRPGTLLYQDIRNPHCLCWACRLVSEYLSLFWTFILLSSVQFSSFAQLCLSLCDTMDCSIPGFPVHYHLLNLAQTHVHWVGDAMFKHVSDGTTTIFVSVGRGPNSSF